MTLAVFLLLLELPRHHRKPGRTTNEKKGKGAKQNLIGQRFGKRYSEWKLDDG
jgi:hypothetical protein